MTLPLAVTVVSESCMMTMAVLPSGTVLVDQLPATPHFPPVARFHSDEPGGDT